MSYSLSFLGTPALTLCGRHISMVPCQTKCKYCIAAAEQEEDEEAPLRKRRRRGRAPARRASREGKEKKKPSWNAYLVWFTQEGNKIREAEPDIPFGEVGKRLKGKWQKVHN